MVRRLAIYLTVGLAADAAPKPFRIQVVDQDTGRGVPLVELTTLNAVRYYTDSNGLIAFNEPALMNRQVFFEVKSHGYRSPRLPSDDKTEGVMLRPVAGGRAQIRIQRINLAERLYRLTGEGIYRDTVLLGERAPIQSPILNAQVMGTDGATTAVYRGRLYWFFGDTNGVDNLNLAAAVAVSDLPGKGGLDPSHGVNLTFFTDGTGFTKPMLAVRCDGGPSWSFAPLTVRDTSGVERLIVRYDCGTGLGRDKPARRGLAVFNDGARVFEPLVDWNDNPVYPDGMAFRTRVNNEDYFYFAGGAAAPAIRVRASWPDVTNPAAYESFTPVTGRGRLDRDERGVLRYVWRRGVAAVGDEQLNQRMQSGDIRSEEAYPYIRDVDTGRPLKARSTSVQWNEFRQRWIMIAQEVDGAASKLGEIWYLEADTPLGPWVYARKILTHDRYSFYEVIHHPALDSEGGRMIHFSGTYSDFLDGPGNVTPRYDYNLILYRLDLTDERLRMPVPVYQVRSADGTNRLLLKGDVEAENAWFRVEAIPCFIPAASRGPLSCEGSRWPNSSRVLFLDREARPARQ